MRCPGTRRRMLGVPLDSVQSGVVLAPRLLGQMKRHFLLSAHLFRVCQISQL